jgi:prostaglandin-E synthase 1
MPNAAANPVFFAYAASAVVNVLNILVLWNLSGAVRGKTKTSLNPEDAAAFKADLAQIDPPEVARVLRAHRNTADNTLPFLLLGLVFAMLGPSELEAQIIFYGFAGARVLYSFAYLKGLQPWRTIFYGLGTLATLALLIDICRLLAAA